MIRRILKWLGIVLGGVLGLLLATVVALLLIGGARVNRRYEISVEAVAILDDRDSLQHGEHVATTRCMACHTDNLGGELFFNLPGLLSIPTPNLTSGAGGIGRSYTDADWVRAIRHGVAADGRGLLIMPAQHFYYLSDQDLGALIAYLKSAPPVDNELPERRIEPMGRVMTALGMIPRPAVDRIDHTAPRPIAPELGVTTEYGEYLAHTAYCVECHGPNLNGALFGPPGEEIPTPNLTPGGELAFWSEEGFIQTLRTGVTPGGHELSETMPWQYFRQMTDDELRALWLYLKSLPAMEQGTSRP